MSWQQEALDWQLRIPGVSWDMSNHNTSSTIDTADALLKAYAAGHRDFTSISLSDANLSHADLKGADLSYADLSAADLSHASLRGADLSYANLREAQLVGTDLRGAMLIGTDLRQANLESANLHQADYDPDITHLPAGLDPVQVGMCSDR